MRRDGGKNLRAAGVIGVAILVAALSIRDWTVRAPRSHPLAAVAEWWSSHPAVLTESLMIEAARAARDKRSLGSEQRLLLRSVVRRAPLEAKPFLLEGAVAQLAGDMQRATELYRAARLRDPRDPAARLLLADLELRQGMVEQGLGNLVAIARIEQETASPIVPAIAQYARSPGAAPRIRGVFVRNPILAERVLVELAADPRNASLIGSLAPPHKDGPPRPWDQRLIESTMASGDVAAARRLWLQASDLPDAPGKVPFNANFRNLSAKPPFNWELLSGPQGLAEFGAAGGMSVIHYGREPALLARQLLLLPPGRYTIRTLVRRSASTDRLQWRLQCIDGGEAQTAPVSETGGAFQAAPGCRAHWLELHAPASEGQSETRLILDRVELARVSG